MSLATKPTAPAEKEQVSEKASESSQSASTAYNNGASATPKKEVEEETPARYEHDEHNSSIDSSDMSQDSISTSSQSASTPKAREFPRKRRRTTPNELFILETEFARNNKPDRMEREKIAAMMTDMNEKAVQVWFQNKRQSCRRNQNSSHTVFGACMAVRTQSAPTYRDENNIPIMANFGTGQPFTQPNALFPQSMGTANNLHATVNTMPQAKKPKSLRLSMSADGKAEIVERSPLKQLNMNTQNYYPAGKLATMPITFPKLNGVEADCANSLLCLKSGQWN